MMMMMMTMIMVVMIMVVTMMMCGVLSEFLHYVAEPSTRTGDCQ